MQEIVYGTRALVRYLPSYSPDFNLIEGSYHQTKDFIRENDIALPLRLLCMLLRKFHEKTAKVISETLAMSGDSTRVKILNPLVTYIGVSCARSYNADLQNYLLLF